MSKFQAIIFDLGGVLVNWDPHSGKSISARQLKALRSSRPWHDLDCGTISLDEAYEHFSKILNLDSLTVKTDLDRISKSLTIGKQLVQVAEELKESYPDLNFYIMSNISREHFEAIQDADLPWSMFSSVFISGALGMRKPDLRFFQYVVNAIGIDPRRIVMVDDKNENLRSARSIGINGLLADKSLVEVSQTLRDLFLSSMTRTQNVGG